MITKGDVSLDVEDGRGPDEWPNHADISTGFLQYTVHLPLDPKVHVASHLNTCRPAPSLMESLFPSKTID